MNQQFPIGRYKIRRDRNSFGEGLLFYVNENVPCRELTVIQIDSVFEIIFLILRTQGMVDNWLIQASKPKRRIFLKKSWRSCQNFSF